MTETVNYKIELTNYEKAVDVAVRLQDELKKAQASAVELSELMSHLHDPIVDGHSFRIVPEYNYSLGDLARDLPNTMSILHGNKTERF